MNKKQIVWFEEVDKEDVGLVGGKGANLGEMLQARFPVPYGFIVTASAYFEFIRHNHLAQKIASILSSLNYESQKELTTASSAVKKLILHASIPHELVKSIIAFYDELPLREKKIFRTLHTLSALTERLKDLYAPPFVAVRSSATAEDLPTASFAGQQETYLNVRGENHLIQKVRECWASLFTERALYYRHEKKFDHAKIGLAAVVQRMVASDKSGIAFSIDPVTNNKSVMTIEAIFGLGEYIVQGKVTPDHYEVEKRSLTIIKKDIKRQLVKYVKKGQRNVEIKLTKRQGEQEKVSDDEVVRIAKLVKEIEKHYYFPQDIEWAIQNDQVYIVQSRPITTTQNQKSIRPLEEKNKKSFEMERHLLLKGDPASPGIAFGKPVIIHSPKEIDKIQKGDVLIASQTNPDYVPAMKKASAIVTEKGGRTSHAAIVSRELGVPAVVGASGAIKTLRYEKIISVNGSTGEIFRGAILQRGLQKKTNQFSTVTLQKQLRTMTKIYVNLSESEEAERIAKMNVDGVGLLRAEFMIAQIGVHPKEMIKQKKAHVFIRQLAHHILCFAKAFAPRPVIYRATDFKTNEYRNLKGGFLYEPKEENPMIGFRGAARYIADSQVFGMEIAAIKKVREQNYKNIHLMIPFIRAPQELIKIKQILANHDLLNLPSFKLWIMIEVPSAVILLEDFIKIGIDGVSIGTNDLTMLLMGVDRDNHEVAHLYDEQSPAIVWALEKIVRTARKYNITCSVCGQVASDYPDMVKQLVKWGITSLSVSPDAIERTRSVVFEIEKHLWQKSKKL